MAQSTVIVGALLAGFVLYTGIKGRWGTYKSLLGL